MVVEEAVRCCGRQVVSQTESCWSPCSIRCGLPLHSAAWSALAWITSPLPVTITILTLVYAYYYVTKDYDFWVKRGVPGPRAVLPWGNEFGVQGIGRTTHSGFEHWIYSQLNGGKFCGFLELTRPVLCVGDPDLITAITAKDFEHFTDRRNRTLSSVYSKLLPFLSGREWKKVRSELSPSFSSGKIKAMLPLCLQTAANLRQYLDEEIGEKGVINMKRAFGCFSMDTIASTAFGVESNSFNDMHSELFEKAAAFFKKPGMYGSMWAIGMRLLPYWMSAVLPDPYEHVRKYFTRITEETIRKREDAGVARRDFFQLLLETKDENGVRCFSDDDIMSHCLGFYTAGHDTTANLLTFAAYALATEPLCQEEVHRELDAVLARHGGQITYEAISELHYMDRVLSETLRLYPAPYYLERVCTKEYTLPDTDVHIPVGTLVHIPVLPLQRDPRFYPNPLHFDPDRFLPQEKEKHHPGTFLVFGSGPKTCLARRFALVEAKVALVTMLKDFQLQPGPDTPPPPLPLDPGAVVVSPDSKCCLLKVLPRSEL